MLFIRMKNYTAEILNLSWYKFVLHNTYKLEYKKMGKMDNLQGLKTFPLKNFNFL